MCAIVGSYDTDKLRELAVLNSYRGQHSYSIAYFDPMDKRIIHLERNLGEIPLDRINIPEGCYGICHVQAPTTDAKTIESVHPAEHNGDLLWHNGILKDRTVQELKADYFATTAWDTKLLLLHIQNMGCPEEVDGTFSCLWYDSDHRNILLFRNEISPMFYDDDGNISSTRFEDSRETEPNKMLLVDFLNSKLAGPMMRLNPVQDFTTVENPYFFA
jgi:asparagine synthetase B (glutamine-hydrolysing)